MIQLTAVALNLISIGVPLPLLRRALQEFLPAMQLAQHMMRGASILDYMHTVQLHIEIRRSRCPPHFARLAPEHDAIIKAQRDGADRCEQPRVRAYLPHALRKDQLFHFPLPRA